MTPSPETRLWRGVILQALIDAVANPELSKEAVSWATSPREKDDFEEVCELAGWGPREVQAAVLRYAARPGSWSAMLDLLDYRKLLCPR